MCVAVIVESKYNIRKKDLLAMEGDNPDGAGIAWIEDGVVHFKRGLTASEVFDLQKGLPRPFFLHFRYATRGGKGKLLTHPFPLGMDSFTAGLEGTSDEGVLMHNGTWSDYRKWIPEGIDPDKVSDTQVAAYAAIASGDHDILDEVRWATAIIFKEKNRWLINYRGDWTVHKGNRYSNLHWKTRSRVTSYSSSYKPYVPSKAYETWWNKEQGKPVYDYEQWCKDQKAKQKASQGEIFDYEAWSKNQQARHGQTPAMGSPIPAPDSPTGNLRIVPDDSHENLWDKLVELEDDTQITMSIEEVLEDLETENVDDRWLDPDMAEIEASLQRAWLEGDDIGGEG